MPASTIANLKTAKKIGIIVPSSNTAVEVLTISILNSLQANVIPLFTRLSVTTLAADSKTMNQFEPDKLISCAQLLADAGADFIIWNGTSGMFCGATLEDDKKLAKALSDATGVPCSTNTIATVEALDRLGIKDISLAVPYTDAVTAKLVEFFSREGYNVHSALSQKPTPANNLAIAECSAQDISQVVRDSVKPDTKAVLIACTNYPGTAIAADLERELGGVVVLDSIAVSAWFALQSVGITGNRERMQEWGSLLASL